MLLIAGTSRAGAIGGVLILLAAVIILIRHRDWTHLRGVVPLTAVAAAVTIRGWSHHRAVLSFLLAAIGREAGLTDEDVDGFAPSRDKNPPGV